MSGTVGGLLGGYLSDVIGRRQIIVMLLLLSVVGTLGVLQTDSIALWLMIALTGAAIQGCHSVLTVKAQESLPDNVGMALRADNRFQQWYRRSGLDPNKPAS